MWGFVLNSDFWRHLYLGFLLFLLLPTVPNPFSFWCLEEFRYSKKMSFRCSDLANSACYCQRNCLFPVLVFPSALLKFFVLNLDSFMFQYFAQPSAYKEAKVYKIKSFFNL